MFTIFFSYFRFISLKKQEENKKTKTEKKDTNFHFWIFGNNRIQKRIQKRPKTKQNYRRGQIEVELNMKQNRSQTEADPKTKRDPELCAASNMPACLKKPKPPLCKIIQWYAATQKELIPNFSKNWFRLNITNVFNVSQLNAVLFFFKD